MNRREKRKLERESAKQPKEIRDLVKVLRMENSPNGDIPVYAFITYGWTFPLYWSRQGKIKSGVSNDPFDDGTIRMKQACSTKTPIAEQPRVIKELKQVWEIPVDLVNLDKSKANKIRNIFDKRCNKALSVYKVKDVTSPLTGEEWYREISIQEIKDLRSNIWEDLLIELGTKAIEKVYKKISPRGLQTPAIKAIIKEFKDGVSRFKGIAPTGFGKTVVAFLTIAKLKAQGLLKNRVVMMTAPNQFLANKNAGAFNEYALCNSVSGIYNIPVFSGSDLGFAESHIEVLERNEKLAAIIQGYLQDDPTAIIVLHTCNPSVQLVDEVLDSIGINEIDFAICDEAHTLASTYDSRWNYVLNDPDELDPSITNRVKIKSRFFLTATEKTLSNPDFLESVPNRNEKVAKFNYMNNKDVFGDYCFKFSFAEGVDAGHIVPMITKVFQYSKGTSSVIDMLQFIDSLDIPELESVKDELGLNVLFDKKFARTLISIISIFKEEKRNKLLTICSRNSHVDLLKTVITAVQQSGKYLQDIEVTDIKACDYIPVDRQIMLDNIHDSNKKQIVITGPWAITGVDCPSLDAVHWNFTPGTEISITQGTGRGARLHEGKQNVLVTFNLDLDNPFHILRGKISSTIGKLYDSMFPSHDVELKARMVRRYGRGFARTQIDTSDTIEESLRVSIDELIEHANGINFKEFIDSFRNRSTEDEIRILSEEFRSQYNSKLIYDKKPLYSEIKKSKLFKSLVNIKLTEVVINKVFEMVSDDYIIIGKYGSGKDVGDGFIQVVDDLVFKKVQNNLIKKNGVDFYGLRIVNQKDEIFKSSCINELYRFIYTNEKTMNSTVARFISFINNQRGYSNDMSICFPLLGGSSKDSFVLRERVCNVLLDKIIKEAYYPQDIIEKFYESIDFNKFNFIEPAFGRRTMQSILHNEIRSRIGDDEHSHRTYEYAMNTKKEKYGDDLSGINTEVSEETREKLRQSTRNWMLNGGAKMLSKKGNSVKIKCPDGHISSKQNAKRYCEGRGLDYSKCIEIQPLQA